MIDVAQPVPRDRHGGLHRHRLAPGLAGGAGPLLQDHRLAVPNASVFGPGTPAAVGGAPASEAEPPPGLRSRSLLERWPPSASPPCCDAPEHEADDVIATLAERATMPVDVVTGDRDLFKLIDDARAVRVLYTGGAWPGWRSST